MVGSASFEEYLRLERTLLENMRQRVTSLRQLLEQVNDHWGYEDGIYRFYHQSFKVFHLQHYTHRIIEALAELAPDARGFCREFVEITSAGTGREFSVEDNQRWVERTAPIVQAFLHARYFLEMAVKYASQLAEPPQPMPSGWAALLCLYDLR